MGVLCQSSLKYILCVVKVISLSVSFLSRGCAHTAVGLFCVVETGAATYGDHLFIYLVGVLRRSQEYFTYSATTSSMVGGRQLVDSNSQPPHW